MATEDDNKSRGDDSPVRNKEQQQIMEETDNSDNVSRHSNKSRADAEQDKGQVIVLESEMKEAEDKDECDTTPGNVVDLSKLNLKYKSHSQSSLQPLLKEYGMAEKPKRRKNKKQDSSWTEMVDEKDREKLTARQEKYKKVWVDVHRLRDLYYEEYMEQLTDKVGRQREAIRLKDEEKEKQMALREQKRIQEARRRRPNMQRVNVNHNQEFLKDVAKSDFYKMVALEERMKSDGQLRTHDAREDFWDSMKQPEELRHAYNKMVGVNTPTSSINGSSVSHQGSFSHHQSRTSSINTAEKLAPPLPPDFRPMTGIVESNELSRPVTRDEVTTSKSSRRIMEPAAIARLAAQELDKKCPQMHLPDMWCFNDDWGEKSIDPKEIQQEMDKERRQKERHLFVKRIHRMYNLSQSNTASTRRILHRHEDQMADVIDPQIDEIIAMNELVYHPELLTADRDAEVNRQQEAARSPWLRHMAVGHHRAIAPIEEVSEDSYRSESVKSASSSKSQTKSIRSAPSRKSRSANTFAPPPVPPISRDLLVQSDKIMEAKCLSSMWNNYLEVGKSKFVLATQE